MTVPVRVTSANHHGADTHLPIPTPLGGDPLARIDAALEVDLSPKAFKLHAALVTRIGEGVLFSIDDMAAASGFSGYQCRPLVTELVNARLVRKHRKVERLGGRVVDVNRYALAVNG